MLKFFTQILVQRVAGLRSFKKFGRFLNRYLSPCKDVSVRVHGSRMYASTLDRIIALYLWKFSALEGFETKIIRKIVKKDMVVFDVGANIGYYTLIFAKQVGSKGKVYAFEPDPENYRLLVKNTRSSGLNNIVPVQKAVSNRNGKIKFFLCEEHRGDHRIYDPGDERKLIYVEAIKLDNFVNRKIQPDMIKMDIEGAELLAFAGMKNIVRKNNKLIILSEFWPRALRQCKSDPEDFIKEIIKCGFTIKMVDENNNKLEQVGTNTLLRKCSDNRYANLLLEKQ